ncbi:MAG TPA: glycosyltransferase family 2 protein [Chloroflexota bacterium]|nr:glycosyltransferase family 2 protein [Chloroflexota bacterium]
MTDSRITAVVLMQDEGPHVAPCLRTLRWADALLVVDGGSRDDTIPLARAAGAHVAERAWDHWTGQRNYALSLVRTPWVLFVDADERVPPELATEMRAAVGRASATTAGDAADLPAGFWIPRQNLILGQWVRHAGWYPDFQLRLFRVDRGRYDLTRQVHELVELDGAAERLSAHLVHHNYVSWDEFWRKQLRYARSEAAQLHARGVRARPRNFALQPLRELRRRYVTLGGFRAGALGLRLSVVLAVANFVMYAELRRLQRIGA